VVLEIANEFGHDGFDHRVRVDSPSVFGAILDSEKGGRFRIAPAPLFSCGHGSRNEYNGIRLFRLAGFNVVMGVRIIVAAPNHLPDAMYSVLVLYKGLPILLPLLVGFVILSERWPIVGRRILVRVSVA
jgi:hypothetical protein